MQMTKKRILLFLIGVFVLFLFVVFLTLNFGYSSGVRTGKLVKISKKGFVLKTYEGTLDLGSGDQLTWPFSVHDDDVGDKLINQTGREVSLKYKEHLFKLFYHTKYNVYDFISIERENQLKMLCRLVSVIKEDVDMVEALRPLIIKYDNDLLLDIKQCK